MANGEVLHRLVWGTRRERSKNIVKSKKIIHKQASQLRKTRLCMASWKWKLFLGLPTQFLSAKGVLRAARKMVFIILDHHLGEKADSQMDGIQ